MILKILGTVLLLFLSCIFLILLWVPKEKEVVNPFKYFTYKKKFEVKLKYRYTSDDGRKEYYEILFTDNNWASSQNILKLYDFTDLGYISVSVSDYSSTLQEAEKLAKTLKSYEDCVNYNNLLIEKVEQLIKQYEDRGIPKEKTEKDKPTPPKIKEIII